MNFYNCSYSAGPYPGDQTRSPTGKMARDWRKGGREEGRKGERGGEGETGAGEGGREREEGRDFPHLLAMQLVPPALSLPLPPSLASLFLSP